MSCLGLLPEKADSADQPLKFRIIAQAVSASGSSWMTKDSDQRFPVKDRLSEADGKVSRFCRRQVRTGGEVSVIPTIADG